MTDEQDFDVLADLLEEPIEHIEIKGKKKPFKITICPVGIPEQRDMARKLHELGVEVGAVLALNEIYPFAFWLLIRQGTPGMTVERIFREDWEIDEKTAVRLYGIYNKQLDVEDKEALTVDRLLRLAGLASEEEDEAGEAEGGGTPPSPQPEEKESNSDEPE